MDPVPGALPISAALMSTQIVDGLGAAAVLNADFVDPTLSSVGITVTMAWGGDDVTEFCLYWLGPTLQVVVPAFRIWPSINRAIELHLTMTPSGQFFPPNATTTTWMNGRDAVRRNEVTISGASPDEINEIKALPWVLRLAIITTNNIRRARLSLQILPINMETLNALTDPESKEIAVISVALINAPWSLTPDAGMKLPGPLPSFRDRRGPNAKASGFYPASQITKKFVRRAMLSCSENPPLSDEEIAALVLDPTSHPPLRPPIVAVWPEIAPDVVPVHVPAGGGAPGGMIQPQNVQSRGHPTASSDQSSLLNAAKASVEIQSGNFGDTSVSDPVPPLSADAIYRKEVMENLFDNDLPQNLPSWELLANIPLNDCASVIAAKRERAKEFDTGTDAEAFAKATAPVSYAAQTDDRLSNLHPASFRRAPLSEPSEWFPKMERKRQHVITFLPENPVGGGIGISDIALKKMSDRTIPLELKHILKANAHVEKSTPISKRRAVESSGIGDTCEITYLNDFDFKEASYPWEVLGALSTAAAVYQQIWPLDYSMLNILRCLIRFQLFYHVEINTKFQLSLCKKFIDEAFLANSRKARSGTPPLSFKQLNDLGAEVLRDKKRSTNPQHYVDLAASNGSIKPGQNSEAFYTYSMTNLAKAQANFVKSQQQQLARIGSYNASKNVGPSKDARKSTKSATITSDPKKGKGIQVCPAFGKGDPCPRGRDSAGSCKAVSGVVLHHVCSTCLSTAHGLSGHK